MIVKWRTGLEKRTRYFFSPQIELTSSAYFWGASRDSLDISTFGIEESLKLVKNHSERIAVYSGITAGYYVSNRKYETAGTTESVIHKNDSGSFDTFITIGTRYTMKNKNSLFVQLNYGISQDSGEIHIFLGLNFPTGKTVQSN